MSDPTKKDGSVKVKPASFKIRRRTSSDQSEKYLNMLIYGDYGSGKTTLAASCVDVPEMNDVLFIDAESGEMTLDDNSRIKRSDHIDVVRVTNFHEVARAQEFLKAHCSLRDNPAPEATLRLRELESKYTGIPIEEIETPRRYRTVMIDSLTEIDTFCLYQLLGISNDFKFDDVDDMDVADWPQFRKNNQMMQLVIRAYRDLPMNVILVCSSQFTQDEQKRKHFAPTLTGKLAGQVAGFMDVVGYLVVGKIPEGAATAPRRLYVQPVKNFTAKNRRSAFKEAYLDDPFMSDVMTQLNLVKPKG